MAMLPDDFPHNAPEGYRYTVLPFKSHIVSIWIVHCAGFTYNGNVESHSIWGFYDTKKQCYYAPINSKTKGAVVDIKSTTPYSSMQLNLNPLELAFI